MSKKRVTYKELVLASFDFEEFQKIMPPPIIENVVTYTYKSFDNKHEKRIDKIISKI